MRNTKSTVANPPITFPQGWGEKAYKTLISLYCDQYGIDPDSIKIERVDNNE